MLEWIYWGFPVSVAYMYFYMLVQKPGDSENKQIFNMKDENSILSVSELPAKCITLICRN